MNTYVHLVMNHELCHPERMSVSPGQDLGWVCLLCVPSSGLTQTGCSWLSREDKKVGLGQEDKPLASQSQSNTPESSSHYSCCEASITLQEHQLDPSPKPADTIEKRGWALGLGGADDGFSGSGGG